MEVLTQIAKTSNYGSSSYYGSTYGSSYNSSSSADILGGLAVGFVIFLVILCLLLVAAAIISLIGQWKMLKKAGKDGYIALIPVYNVIVEMEISGMPIYFWFLNYCSFIPWIGWIGSLAFLIMKNIRLAKSFGKGAGMGVLLTFFPFVVYPILGFGNAEYIGPQNN